MSTQTYDAIVIGAGVGGYVAAIRLAQLKKKVALIERNPTLGGVCLNWGCIPSKALIAAANLVEEMKHAAERGIIAEPPKVDVAKLREFKNATVKKLVGGVGQLEKGNGVEVVKGTATFVAPNAVEVSGGSAANTAAASRNPAMSLMCKPGFPFSPKCTSRRAQITHRNVIVSKLKCVFYVP